MEYAVSILLIIFSIFFFIGIVSGVISFILVKKKKYSIVSIVLSFICWIGITIPIKYAIGFFIHKLAMVIIGIYSIFIITASVKNMKS